MKKIGQNIIIYLVYFLIWLAITHRIEPWNIALGLSLSVICIAITNNVLKISYVTLFYRPIFPMVKFVLITLMDIYVSSYILIKNMVLRKMTINHIIYKTSLNNEYDVSLLANTITLIPGSISVGIDGNKILVVSPEIEKARIIKDIKKIEKNILNIEGEK